MNTVVWTSISPTYRWNEVGPLRPCTLWLPLRPRKTPGRILEKKKSRITTKRLFQKVNARNRTYSDNFAIAFMQIFHEYVALSAHGMIGYDQV